MTANNLGTMCALIPPTANSSSNALHAVRYGRQPTEKREASPSKRACAATPMSGSGSQTKAITPTVRLATFFRSSSRRILTFVDAHSREMRRPTGNDKRPRSIQIRKTQVKPVDHLNLDSALLIPCASLLTVSRTINFLFKVLFIFPSRYLFAIGLVPIFSFRRSLPPILGCIPKQPDSWKAYREWCHAPRTGLSPSTMCRSRQLERTTSTLKTLLEATIRCCKQQRF